jgi:transposase-like protein
MTTYEHSSALVTALNAYIYKTIDFMLSEKRDAKALPRVITIDKNPTYPAAIEILKKNKELPQEIYEVG